MPVREVLECDAPGCTNVAVYVGVTVGGKTYEVLLCDEHTAPLREAAKWGRLLRGTRGRVPASRPRDASEDRLVSLIRRDHTAEK